MKLIQKIVKDLGSPYEIKTIDLEDVIYRKLETGYEFEVSGITSKKFIVYVWSVNPSQVVGTYTDLPTEHIKDILGYIAVKYQNLSDKIQIEREDQIV
jgi:hypothetical protein